VTLISQDVDAITNASDVLVARNQSISGTARHRSSLQSHLYTANDHTTLATCLINQLSRGSRRRPAKPATNHSIVRAVDQSWDLSRADIRLVQQCRNKIAVTAKIQGGVIQAEKLEVDRIGLVLPKRRRICDQVFKVHRA